MKLVSCCVVVWSLLSVQMGRWRCAAGGRGTALGAWSLCTLVHAVPADCCFESACVPHSGAAFRKKWGLWSARSWLSRFLLKFSSGDRTSHEDDREWRKQGRKQFLICFPALTVPFCRDISNSLFIYFSKLWTSQMPVEVSFPLPFRLCVLHNRRKQVVACLVYVAASEKLPFLKFYSLCSSSPWGSVVCAEKKISQMHSTATFKHLMHIENSSSKARDSVYLELFDWLTCFLTAKKTFWYFWCPGGFKQDITDEKRDCNRKVLETETLPSHVYFHQKCVTVTSVLLVLPGLFFS